MTEVAYEAMPLKEARRRLKVSQPEFNALLRSRLLGKYSYDGYVLLVGIEDYERYGTQWITEDRDDLEDRLLTSDLIDSIPPPPDHGPGEQTGVQQKVHIFSDGVPDYWGANATDTGWLAHFYLRPNTYFFPAPTTFGMVGGQLLKLAARRKVPGAELPTCLYPDPTGSLGLIAVTGFNRPLSEAYDTAYDIVGPILDELSARYDVPLPIAHMLMVQIPSGVMTTMVPKAPKAKTLSKDDPVLPACPYPRLRAAVALYREGVSSNNPFHQFLTLWRTYENVCEVRGAWRKEHKRPDLKPREEAFPTGAFGYQGYEGMKFDKVKQKLERPFRVALAHGSNIKDGKPITAASAKDLMSVAYAVPIIRYMAQVALENVRATLDSSDERSPDPR